MVRKLTEHKEHTSTVHNFNEEYKMILILGGFAILKEPYLGYVLNLLLIVCVVFVYVFLAVMAVVTLVLKSDEKVVIVKIIQTLCVLAFAIIMPAARYRTRGHLDSAVRSLNRGIYKYQEGKSEIYFKIKNHRVAQIKSIESLLVKICLSCAILNTVLVPLKNLALQNDNTDNILNPYLPLPIYMPFNTSTTPTYIIAFLSNAAFNFFLFFATVFSTLNTYTSCALQLIAEVEILIESLKNIEKRAYNKLFKYNSYLKADEQTNPMNESRLFQRILSSCLKENILHHHAILRFSKAIKPFIETLSFLSMCFFSLVSAASLIAIVENSSINIEVMGTLTLNICCFSLMCWLGQFIQDKSAQITSDLYFTPWPHCDNDFKSLLRMMLMNTQKPITLKTPGFDMDMSLATLGDSIAKGYKITNLLR